MTTLSQRPGREQDLIAVGLTALFAFILVGSLWWFDQIQDPEVEAAAADYRRLLALQRIAGDEHGLSRLRTQIEALGESSSSLLEGESPNLAGASLQSRLADLITAQGGRVESSLLLPAEPEARLIRVPVRIVGVMDIVQLQNFLHAVETKEPLLFVGPLQLESLSRRQPGRPTARPALRVTVTVSGYLAGSESSS